MSDWRTELAEAAAADDKAMADEAKRVENAGIKERQAREAAAATLQREVVPALEEIREVLRPQNRDVEITIKPTLESPTVTAVFHIPGRESLKIDITTRVMAGFGVQSFIMYDFGKGDEVVLLGWGEDKVTKEVIIAEVVKLYKLAVAERPGSESIG